MNLESASARVRVDVNNLESVMGLLEMGRVVKQIPDMSKKTLAKLPDMLTSLIAATLERSVQYDRGQSKLAPDQSYGSFADLIRQRATARHSMSVITLNYDYALEVALELAGLRYNYLLEVPTPIRRTKTPNILKLHGSLNWGECQNCHHIIAYPVDEYLSRWVADHPYKPNGAKRVTLDLSEKLKEWECPRCHVASKAEPKILAPTWNKEHMSSPPFDHLIERAYKELAGARRVYIVGYSMPDTDLFMRNLLAIGLARGQRLERLWVFNPDKRLAEKYSTRIAGSAISDDGRFRYYATGFAEAVKFLQSESNGYFTSDLKPESLPFSMR